MKKLRPIIGHPLPQGWGLAEQWKQKDGVVAKEIKWGQTGANRTVWWGRSGGLRNVYILDLGHGAVPAGEKGQTQGSRRNGYLMSIIVTGDEPAAKALCGQWVQVTVMQIDVCSLFLCLSSSLQDALNIIFRGVSFAQSTGCPAFLLPLLFNPMVGRVALHSVHLLLWNICELQIDAAHILPQIFILCFLPVTKLTLSWCLIYSW